MSYAEPKLSTGRQQDSGIQKVSRILDLEPADTMSESTPTPDQWGANPDKSGASPDFSGVQATMN
jgi:hypothetical protein